MADLAALYRVLEGAYGARNWWPARTPFEMMVGAVLTQNTAWSNVEKALANFGGPPEPAQIDAMPLPELTALIRPSGFYNQKAPRLKALTRWYARYGWDIDKARAADGAMLRAELLAVSGIGNETADSILLYALEKPYFVIDKYTRRLLERLGFDPPPGYDALAAFFTARLERDVALYNQYHALIVEHSKRHCKAAPQCAGCPLAQGCERRGVERKQDSKDKH